MKTKEQFKMTLQMIEDLIMTPTFNQENIYLPTTFKSKFLKQMKRLGRVTRINNRRLETSTYKLYPDVRGLRLPTYQLKMIVEDKVLMKEDTLVELFFKLVEMGYSINVFYDIISLYNESIEKRRTFREEFSKVQGGDTLVEEILEPLESEEMVIQRYGFLGKV